VLPFTLLSDKGKDVSKAYGTKGRLWSSRVTFLISPERRIEKIYKKMNVNTHAGEFLTISWEKNSLVLILLLGFLQSQESNQIYGFITDENSGEALIGTNVYLTDPDRGTATNHDGYFVIYVKKDDQ